MQEVIKRRQEEIDKNSPKSIGKPFKELAEPVLAVMSFINGFVQTASAGEPPLPCGYGKGGRGEPKLESIILQRFWSYMNF